MNLIFFTNSNKFINNKLVDWVGCYNVGMNHVNIQGGMEILNFEFQNIKTHIFGTLNNVTSKTF